MTNPLPIDDALDANLQALFVPFHPRAGFEDRLVNAVRHQRRWSIPTPIYKAAIAAAAVLAVGTTGYFGNRAIIGHPRLSSNQALSAAASPVQQEELRRVGGGSNSTQNGLDYSDGVGANRDSIYQKSAENIAASSNGWQQKMSDATRAPNAFPSDNFNVVLKPQSVRRLNDSLNSGGKIDTASLRSPAANQPVVVGSNYFHGLARAGNLGVVETEKSAGLSWSDDQSATQQKQVIVMADGREGGAGGGGGGGGFGGGSNAAALTVDAPPVAPPAAPGNAAPVTSQPTDDRKIIRTGNMEFEVDRFDTAQTQIIKIVGELGGFVGATDSQKLPNGKVRGSITVRVAPEQLDALVMSLRALGDLKNQQISAMDVTKEYTDLQSELTADRAMQDRLLDLIKTGKGSVKDLLAAENELGTWREKIEKAEGSLRYYNAQVALSTLVITLSERDIQTPATLVETQTADVGIEADDVEKARDSAIKAIEDAKGRIIEAELKRYDAGQFAGRLVADVPPESAGAVIDQLKLLGKVARLEVHRQQANGDQTPSVATPAKTDRRPTRLLISIYNLANIAPRRTTTINLAADDV